MTERAEIYEFLEAKERDRAAVVSWIHRGDYEEPQLYARGDVVRMRGASYVAVSDCPGDCPTDGWQLVAEVGERGEKGARGEQGYSGKQGMAGPPGEMGPPGRSVRWRGRYVPFTTYSRDDVVYFDNALFIALRDPSDEAPKADQINWDLMIRFHAPDMTEVFRQINTKMFMVADYAPGTDVVYGAVVTDEGWLMHANKATSDRAAPQAFGPVAYLYEGAAPQTNALAKQVLFGNRYTFNAGGYLTGYRIYTVADQHYTVYTVVNPDTDNQTTQLFNFDADLTEWRELSTTRRVILSGDVVELLVVVSEPDPTPTEFTDTWTYSTPNNVTIPGPGEITHSDKALGLMRVSYTSDGGTDFENQLNALVIGDTINGANQSWIIQSMAPAGSYIEFGVSPSVQGAPDGLAEFSFGTTAATPIDYLVDPDWWANNPGDGLVTMQGVFASDGIAGALDDNAYGTDMLLQQATASPDWDFMAYSG